MLLLLLKTRSVPEEKHRNYAKKSLFHESDIVNVDIAGIS